MRHDEGALHNILKLADVTGPVISLRALKRALRDNRRRDMKVNGGLANEVGNSGTKRMRRVQPPVLARPKFNSLTRDTLPSKKDLDSIAASVLTFLARHLK